ncbi:MAG: N-formylglutamate amidohydrolase [Deltaproteobacteria bacterium]|jgi:formiminoglutamase|nr:N-formylglutamate amidohydrolase [Deltaproteobacteria bacterium]
MKLPFLVSVPHAGLQIPREVQDICILSPEDIYADSDGGAAEIYFDLEKHVESFISSDVARAIVDLNRAVDDFRKDGVIKTHTCYDVPVYRKFPSPEMIQRLLASFYHPYHQQLESLADKEKIRVGIDCHTMAAVGPPVGPDAGKERPLVCLSNADGTCPDEWLYQLARSFEKVFPDEKVNINSPFKGGYIVRNHSAEMPWLQIELSRTERISDSDKKTAVWEALSAWSNNVLT